MTPSPREIVLHRTLSRLNPWTECQIVPFVGHCGIDEHLVVVPKDALKQARIEALEAAKEALWERVGREEYGHAKAAVTLDIEAIEALLARERGDCGLEDADSNYEPLGAEKP